MKNGKYVPIGEYKNVKIGYGTVDYKNLKTIYLKLNSWVEPNDDDVDFNFLVSRARKVTKHIVFNLGSDFFMDIAIVDLDIRTKGLKSNKRSFMNLEVTLYVTKQFDIRSKEVKLEIRRLSEQIIDKALDNKNLFNFYKTKK